MIPSQIISVKVSNKNLNHYRKYFPYVNSGDIINVDIYMLTKGSRQKIKAKCDVCGKEKEMMYKTYLRISNKKSEYFCKDCKSIKTKNTVENKYGVENVFQLDKIKELSKETCNKKYNKDFYQQTDEYKEKCKNTSLRKYGVEYPMQSDEIKNKIDFKLTPEQISKMILTTRNNYSKIFFKKANIIHGYKYDYSRSIYINMYTKIIIGCPKHGDFTQRPMDHVNSKQGCPICSESKGERKIRIFLNSFNISFTPQKKFCDLRHKNCLSFDFYLPEYNVCIEFDGEQHFAPYDIFGGDAAFEDIQQKDELKNSYCKNNNIKLLRISYLDKNIENIIKNFLSLEERKVMKFSELIF